MRTGQRIVLTTVGSLGDLHPYLAIGKELARRGHHPVIATSEAFRDHVRTAGLRFAPIRAISTEVPSAELVRRVFNGGRGVAYIVRHLVLRSLGTAYADTLAAAEGADLLISHPLTFSTRLVAERRGIPWISTQLAPTGLLSAFDAPVLPGLVWLSRVPVPAGIYRLFYRLVAVQIRRWFRPYDELRTKLGLPDHGIPLLEGGHSPFRELALFSPLFGPPQPDWPPQTIATGFPYFAQPVLPDPALETFLNAGPPPLIFTLGSSAVMDPGNFFKVSAEAARTLGRRALLLGVNFRAPQMLPTAAAEIQTSEDVFACPYGSYAQIFPRGAAIVHQGGVGTTAEALRAGRPMLVVPYGADQPDNAARIRRLGVGRVLGRRQYRKPQVVRALSQLLEEPAFAERAAAIAAKLHAEHGAETACDAIEAVLRQPEIGFGEFSADPSARVSATMQSRPKK